MSPTKTATTKTTKKKEAAIAAQQSAMATMEETGIFEAAQVNEPEAEPKPVDVTALVQPQKNKKSAIPLIHEQFDLNLVTLSGVIHSVWGRATDVFARISISHRGKLIEDEDAFASFATLRFGNGAVDGMPISIQPADVVRVRGYLTHMDYNETLRKFLDDAHGRDFFDQVDPNDLEAWRSLTLKRHNAILNVVSLAILDHETGQTVASFGEEISPEVPVNRANVEGIVARVWEYPHNAGVDLFTRLAVYDEHTPIDRRRAGNFGRNRRLAHYITVRFPNSQTSTGAPVRLKPKTRIRVVGELRDKGQTVTLHEELLKTGMPVVAEMMQRVVNADRMSEISAQQESLHVFADALIVYSTNGGSRR